MLSETDMTVRFVRTACFAAPCVSASTPGMNCIKLNGGLHAIVKRDWAEGLALAVTPDVTFYATHP